MKKAIITTILATSIFTSVLVAGPYRDKYENYSDEQLYLLQEENPEEFAKLVEEIEREFEEYLEKIRAQDEILEKSIESTMQMTDLLKDMGIR